MKYGSTLFIAYCLAYFLNYYNQHLFLNNVA